MIIAGIHETKTYLSRYLKYIEQGEEVYIKRGATTIAKIIPVPKEAIRKRPAVGTVRSAPVGLTEDAFDPLRESELEEWGIGTAE